MMNNKRSTPWCKIVICFYILLVLIITTKSEAREFNVDEFLSKTSIYVGASYKFQEQYTSSHGQKSSPIGARFGITYQLTKHISVGIDHHSQWLTGFPFNSKRDIYSKTEIFIDYRITLEELFN